MGMELNTAGNLAVLLLTGCAAIQDLQKRSISGGLILLFLLPGIPFFCIRLLSGAEGIAAFRSFVPGVLAGVLAAGKPAVIGMGDALYLLTAGCYLRAEPLFLILLSGLLLCGMTGLVLIAAGMHGGKNVRKQELPFLVFLLPAACGVLLC